MPQHPADGQRAVEDEASSVEVPVLTQLPLVTADSCRTASSLARLQRAPEASRDQYVKKTPTYCRAFTGSSLCRRSQDHCLAVDPSRPLGLLQLLCRHLILTRAASCVCARCAFCALWSLSLLNVLQPPEGEGPASKDTKDPQGGGGGGLVEPPPSWSDLPRSQP